MRMPIVCPKCQREHRPGESACARCGLLVARWESYRDETPPCPPVDAAWTELQTRWDDDAAHRRFLETASRADALDLAARYYRRRRQEAPNDVRAAEGLRRAASMAESLHAARAVERRPTRPSPVWRLVSLLGASVVVLGLIWILSVLWRGR
jgi:hypothetical protein